MKRFFEELYEYNHLVNRKIMDQILANKDAITDRSLQLISHMVNAHHVWNTRIREQEHLFGIWDLHSFEDLIQLDQENLSISLHILENYDFNRIINYTNTRGENHSSKTSDILFHIINHSTHHRAQIISDLRLNKIEPVATDYIYFKK